MKIHFINDDQKQTSGLAHRKEMCVRKTILMLIFMKASAAFAFAPQYSIYSGSADVATTPTTSSIATADAYSVSGSLLNDANTFLVSIAEENEIVTRQGLINWGNPGESLLGSIFLLYVVFSILAGIKYVVKDGWRPKL